MIGAIGGLMIVLGFVTTFLDVGMNGSRYAGWAPFGLAMAVIGLILVNV